MAAQAMMSPSVPSSIIAQSLPPPRESPIVGIRSRITGLKSSRENLLSQIDHLTLEKSQLETILPVMISQLLLCHSNVEDLMNEREIYEMAIGDMMEAYPVILEPKNRGGILLDENEEEGGDEEGEEEEGGDGEEGDSEEEEDSEQGW